MNGLLITPKNCLLKSIIKISTFLKVYFLCVEKSSMEKTGIQFSEFQTRESRDVALHKSAALIGCHLCAEIKHKLKHQHLTYLCRVTSSDWMISALLYSNS